MDETTPTEDRQQPRAPIELRVEYTRLNTFFSDYTRNLSKGGTFIKTATPLPVGTAFRFHLAVPTFEKPVELSGEVTWVLPAETSESPPGMGIRFLFASDAERLTFEAAVEQLMVESLGPDISRQLLGRKERSTGS